MTDLNKTFFTGRLTADPELRATQTGISVCRFTVAVKRYAKQGEESKANFFNCVSWREQAEMVTRFLHKGSRVLIEAEMNQGEFVAKDGSKRTTYDFDVKSIQFLDPKPTAEDAFPPKEAPKQKPSTVPGAGAKQGKGQQSYIPSQYMQPKAPQYEEITDQGDLPF